MGETKMTDEQRAELQDEARADDAGSTLDSNGDDFDAVADSMPAPTPGVAEREQAKMDEQEAKQADYKASLRDRDGNPFDPQLHVTDANGDPVLTTSGYARKRPGRKAGTQGHASTLGTGAPNARQSQSEGATGGEDSADKKRAQARQCGSVAAAMFINTAVMTGGEEFKPRGEKECGYDEHAMLQQAFADYFEAKEWSDFPPGIALSMVAMSYVSARFTMPKTSAKAARFVSWLRDKRKKKARQKAKENRKESKDEKQSGGGFFSRGKSAEK